MENTAKDWERRIPPRSKFNDEEATGVLRLIVEQEKLLKNATASPVLNVNIPSNRQKRLPPLLNITQRSESLDENDFENVRSRKTSNPHETGAEIFFSRPTLVKGKQSKSYDDNGSLPGIPSKIPDIFCSPKIARHRERPRGSYGRSQENLRKDSTAKSRSLESCNEQTTNAIILQRPCNPMAKEDLQNCSNQYYPSGDELSGDEYDKPIAPAPPKRLSTPTYIN